MVTFKRFEDLPVCQEAIRLAEGVYNMTESRAWRNSPNLRDQIERAALSVSNNIAEGFERSTTKELLAFCTSPVVRPEKSVQCSFFLTAVQQVTFSNLKFQI